MAKFKDPDTGEVFTVPDGLSADQASEYVARQEAGGAGPVKRAEKAILGWQPVQSALTAAQNVYAPFREQFVEAAKQPALGIPFTPYQVPLPYGQQMGSGYSLAAEAIAPENVGQAAAMGAAFGPFGRMAGALTKAPVVNQGLEILMRAAGIGGTAYGVDVLSGQGERAARDALLMGGSGAVSDVVGILGRTGRQNVIPGAQAAKDTADVLQATKPLYGATTGPGLVDKVYGSEARKAMGAEADAAHAALDAIQPGSSEGLEFVKQFRREARTAQRGPEPGKGFDAARSADELEEGLLSAVRNKPGGPEAVAQYQTWKDRNRQFERVDDFLNDPKAFTPAGNVDASYLKLKLRQRPAKGKQAWQSQLENSGEAGQALVDALGRGDTAALLDIKHTVEITPALFGIRSGIRGRASTSVGVPVNVYRGAPAVGPVDSGLAALIGASGARGLYQQQPLTSMGSPEVDNLIRYKTQEYDQSGRTP